ncbi:dTMP kinase [Candidatus Giovannonibacteria bacterium RIFCSPHIGHO2_01_FULL_48_47]|nr:MAG: dTMP kinase [Candidatus Giovannonibacteria bacterium RIFCSPHIGHO2_01_FULL_48_47]OGF68494.1 MAG: dTMP kinase [Candidatus Giovannonibacteria bacterium RIFCSPHIGHO2_02_FULL_48_15]OGF88457.1 MAG: dTMP kinase [Candidatus Giovannonibacteria bacterium RIFCSPLOWO2_01_FULL_48_47]OGF94886.1 MAG: dTMP kinase [Candidatus Giovannonibacteria bacterium RIFOXYC1_FULL_48_8]OGF96513.1 MAG: dTMP kinase [Candidatus Giovannonibacteria bacterium RIFOXYD1_FULL_48_21]HBT81187.1 dTMP kinase [Candidatus Giovann
MNRKPPFIVFEGLDGSGHSTQADLLKNFLEKRGRKILLTKEPTLDSAAGRKIRKTLEHKIKLNPKELQDLFTKDRAQHLKKTILPALKRGQFVISDRYFFSTFAFGAASGVNLPYLIRQNKKFLHPDITFILDVKPQTSIFRIEKRGKPKELFEKIEKLSKVREVYRSFPKKFKNVYMINGEKSIGEVFKQIKRRIMDYG